MLSASCLLLSITLLLLTVVSGAEAYSQIEPASRSRLWKAASGKKSVAVLQPSCQETRRRLSVLRSGGSGDVVKPNRFWCKQLLRELLAEFIGTGIVVGLGLMSVMSAVFTDSLVGLFQIASVWIIAVTIAVATTGPISGAHLNPAISLSLALLRPSKNCWAKLFPYAVAQTAGAAIFTWVDLILYASKIEAFEASKGIIRGTVDSIASARVFGEYFADSVTAPVAFFAEVFGTALLAFVVFALTNPRNDTMKNKVYVPPLIGLHVGALIAGIAPLTQACFNPARDFGPRIVAYFAGWGKISFQGWWLYVVAPLIGAPIGAWIADTVLYGGGGGDDD